MAEPISSRFVTAPELARWCACAAVVLAAHGVIAAAIAARPDEVEDVDAGSPVVMLELAPIAAAPPAPQADLAPGPQVETQAQEEVAEQKEPERQEPEKERVEEMPAPNPLVALAPTEPEKEQPDEAKPEQRPVEAVPVPTAPPPAPTPEAKPAAPAPGTVARPNPTAVLTWQRLLVTQLERHKRYPPNAHGALGEANLAFRLDRTGRVLSSRILRSSGSAALDEEALALIKRAQPLPAPPPGIAEQQLSFVVPIRYH
jgi:protein TonB